MLLHKGSFAKRVEHTEIQTACRTCKRCRFTFPTLPRPRHPVFISSLLFRLSLRVPESSAVQLYNSTFPSLPPTLPTPPTARKLQPNGVVFPPALNPLRTCSDYSYDETCESEYDEGLGSSYSSIGFSELKVGEQSTSDNFSVVGLAGAFPSSLEFSEPTHKLFPILFPGEEPLGPNVYTDWNTPQSAKATNHTFRPTHFNDHSGPAIERIAPPEGASARTLDSKSKRKTNPTIPSHTTKPHNKKKGNTPEKISARTHDANGKKIKRPMNAYMLWLTADRRKDCLKTTHSKRGLMHEAEKCVSAGKRWKMLDEKVKAEWFEKAAEVKEQHQKDHPLWKYTPKPAKGNKRKKGEKRAAAPSAARLHKRSCNNATLPATTFGDFASFNFKPDCQRNAWSSSISSDGSNSSVHSIISDGSSSDGSADSISSDDELFESLNQTTFMDFAMEDQLVSSVQAFENIFAQAAATIASSPTNTATISSTTPPGDAYFTDNDLSDLLSIFD